MKTTHFLSATILLLFMGGIASSQKIESKNSTSHFEAITISTSPDLNALTSLWVSEYSRSFPERKIRIENENGLKISDNLHFVSNKSLNKQAKESDWKMVVGRDVTIPVINLRNPFLKELMSSGISQQKLAQVFNFSEKQNWGILLGDNQKLPVHLYVIDDESVKESVSAFLQITQMPLASVKLGTKAEVISAVQKDPLAIGFCKIENVIGTDNRALLENIGLMPIDNNNNGTLDYMENIYSDINTFIRGVWIGKYPKPLYSNIYAVSGVPPSTEEDLAFLSWVITDGQQYLNTNGYCELAASESQSQYDRLNTSVVSIAPVKETSNSRVIVLILAVLIVVGFVVSVIVRRYRKQSVVAPEFNLQSAGFNENGLSVPNGMYFDKSHTWAFMEKDGTISVGIDDFLQHITGPITRVEMKNPGEKIKKGDLLFSIIQSGKQLSMYSPVSGTIKKQNEILSTNASILNTSPYSNGWVYSLDPVNWFGENQLLSRADKHKRWLSTEFSRVKDFFAAALKPGSLEYTHVILQDGGVLKEGILADFGPEVWEDFQTNFLDNYK